MCRLLVSPSVFLALRPDILIKTADGKSFVIDTKWKNLSGTTPSSDDLRQLYVYHEYFHAEKVAIMYPGSTGTLLRGNYISPSNGMQWSKECTIMPVAVEQNITRWQQCISRQVQDWIK